MNFIIVISAFTIISIRGTILHENLDFARLAIFEKRHALTAEQVLSDANNNNVLNEMVEYKPYSFA